MTIPIIYNDSEFFLIRTEMLIYDSLEPCERTLYTFATTNEITRLIFKRL